jgi:prepilin-type N-terminal cleavage/methylation domain-containing protein
MGTQSRHFLPNRLGSGEDGVTLVEVLAAMTILALGLLALMPMAVTSMSANDSARDTRAAMEQIQNRIERLRIADSIVAGTQFDTLSGMSTSWWTENESADLKKLIVEVTWTGDGAVARRQRGTAYIYKK